MNTVARVSGVVLTLAFSALSLACSSRKEATASPRADSMKSSSAGTLEGATHKDSTAVSATASVNTAAGTHPGTTRAA